MMTPLGTIFRPGSNKPPKIDQHSLFTSIQVSVAILEGDLQVWFFIEFPVISYYSFR